MTLTKLTQDQFLKKLGLRNKDNEFTFNISDLPDKVTLDLQEIVELGFRYIGPVNGLYGNMLCFPNNYQYEVEGITFKLHGNNTTNSILDAYYNDINIGRIACKYDPQTTGNFEKGVDYKYYIKPYDDELKKFLEDNGYEMKEEYIFPIPNDTKAEEIAEKTHEFNGF